MTEVEILEQHVQKLKREELDAFRKWFLAYDAEDWDRQLEADANAGKLDQLAAQALADHGAGRTKEQ